MGKTHIGTIWADQGLSEWIAYGPWGYLVGQEIIAIWYFCAAGSYWVYLWRYLDNLGIPESWG